jgi:hypothetical protein
MVEDKRDLRSPLIHLLVVYAIIAGFVLLLNAFRLLPQPGGIIGIVVILHPIIIQNFSPINPRIATLTALIGIVLLLIFPPQVTA